MISNRGLELIKEFEGCVLTSYRDPVGVWTIGYGHTKNVHEGMEISQRKADELLREDVEIYFNKVMEYDDIYHWNPNQIDALTSFAYNIGSIDQLTKEGQRSIEEISRCIPLYCKAGGQVLEGLKRRREAERELFDEPVEASTSSSDSEPSNSASEVTEGQEETHSESESYYKTGETYTVDVSSALNVRRGAGTDFDLVGYAGLTPDGKKHANAWGALLDGTRVTCLDIVNRGDETWIEIPSGWICAKSGNTRYVI